MIDPTLPRVVIFGGGIAGLSAAHELAERGFKVHVVESRPHPLRPGTCLVGGMAATQWSRFPFDPRVRTQPRGMRRARPPWELDWEANVRPGDDDATRARKAAIAHGSGPQRMEIRFADGTHALDATAKACIGAVAAYVKKYVDEHVRPETMIPHLFETPRPDASPRPETLVVEGFQSGAEPPGLAAARAEAVATALEKALGKDPLVVIVPRGLDCAPDDAGSDAARARCVRFRILEVRLPGEHGYRFFPAFYRHLFDTMKRTPIYFEEPVSPEQRARGAAGDAFGTPRAATRLVPSGRTAYDNLVEAEYHSIEQDDHKISQALPRRRPPSAVGLYEIVTQAQKELGFSTADLVRSGVKMLQYLTAHPDRRAGQYEEMSWSQFIGVDIPGRYSPTFDKALELWPQALIGLRPTECDARTAGNVTVQILLDMAKSEGFRDGTLNAPTSEAWLDVWQRHLESLGVEFHLGRLDALRWRDGGIETEHEVVGEPVDTRHAYVMVALPPERVAQLAHAVVRDAYAAGADPEAAGLRDFERLAQLLPLDLRSYQTNARPAGPFRHFNGIQYYLAHDFALIRGHTYYAAAPWGLTSISQAQFRVAELRGPFRGILSVDIGAWAEQERERHGDRRTAWECDADEVAAEIWAQIGRGVDNPVTYFPWPLWYHIDDALAFETATRDYKINHTPYLLNWPREWKLRPGDDPVVQPSMAERVKRYGGFTYSVARSASGYGGVVLTGNFTKTYTRLGTMEAANESARHAVSSLIEDWIGRTHHTRRVPQWCRTWNLEDYELKDFDPLKDLDRLLYQRGLPHVVDILELERTLLPETTAPDDAACDAALRSLLRFFESPDTLLQRIGGGSTLDGILAAARSLFAG